MISPSSFIPVGLALTISLSVVDQARSDAFYSIEEIMSLPGAPDKYSEILLGQIQNQILYLQDTDPSLGGSYDIIAQEAGEFIDAHAQLYCATNANCTEVIYIIGFSLLKAAIETTSVFDTDEFIKLVGIVI